MICHKSKKLFLLCAFFILCASCNDNEQVKDQSMEIRQLDSLVANKLDFRIKRDRHIADLKKRLHSDDLDAEHQYIINGDIADNYFGYQSDVYAEIKRKLVEDHGIPANEIRFIQEGKNDKQRKELIKGMNEGKIRVLFGSTSMLGTGVNAQKRAVAVHHLDTPWRPSDLAQRDGRAVRKGNEIAKFFAENKVDVIIYAVEKALDSYKFNLLYNKQLFIDQLKNNNLGKRTIDEGSMDEKSGMNFSEYVAILSGNTDLLDKAKYEYP